MVQCIQCLLHSGKFWRGFQFGDLVVSINIKPHGTDRKILALQNIYLYTLRECDNVGKSSLSVRRKFALLTSVWGALWTVTLYAPRRPHLEAKWITMSTHQRRRWRCDSMAPKMSRHNTMLLDTSLKILDGKLPWWYFGWKLNSNSPNKNVAYWLKSPTLMPTKFSHYAIVHSLDGSRILY